MPTCRLLRSCTLPEEHFPDIDALARRIAELRDGRELDFGRCVVTVSGDPHGRQAVAVHVVTSRETVGYAVVGDPPLPAGEQLDRLQAALAALLLVRA